MLASNIATESFLLSDIYQVKKPNVASRKSKNSCQRDFSDGFAAGFPKEARTNRNKLTRLKELPTNDATALELLIQQSERMSKKKVTDNVTTPVRASRFKRRSALSLAQSTTEGKILRAKTPGKVQKLDDDIQSSSCTPSPRVSNLCSSASSNSPLFCSSPGRNFQSSQDPSQDVIWNLAASPIHYQFRRSACDASNIKELLQPWVNAKCKITKPQENGNSNSNSLIDTWEKAKSEFVPVARNRKEMMQNTRKVGSAMKNAEELLAKLEDHTKGNKISLSPIISRTRANSALPASPNSSTDELWGEDDESFETLMSQMSPVLFQDTQCSDSSDANRSPNNCTGSSRLELTSPSETPSKKRSKENEKSPNSSMEELWGSDDISEVFSQEILTLMEQALNYGRLETPSQSRERDSAKCRPDEIERKRHEARSKLKKRKSTL